MKLSDAAQQFIDETDSKKPSRRALNATRHGAYSYLNRVKNDQPIPESLSLVESAVQRELLEGGALNLMRANVIRLQTSADLLWSYMKSSSDNFHSGLRSFGWLTNASIRALEKLAVLEKDTARDRIDLVTAMSQLTEDEPDES